MEILEIFTEMNKRDKIKFIKEGITCIGLLTLVYVGCFVWLPRFLA